MLTQLPCSIIIRSVHIQLSLSHTHSSLQYLGSDFRPVPDEKLKTRSTVAMLQESWDDKLKKNEFQLYLPDGADGAAQSEVIRKEVLEEKRDELTREIEDEKHTHSKHNLGSRESRITMGYW